MESKNWYAVMMDNEDTDHGYGSFDIEKAIKMANEMRNDGYTNAFIAVIDPEDDFCMDEIHNF